VRKYAALAVLAASERMAAAVLFAGLTGEKASPPDVSLEDRVPGKFIRHSAPRDVADIAFTDAGRQAQGGFLNGAAARCC